jgi:alpha-tubulin suppressor-like RCC1 family protein
MCHVSGRQRSWRLTFAACFAFLFLLSCSDSTAPGNGPQPSTGLALAIGGRHGCRLTTDGRALCWGRADAGQLGIGATPLRSPTVQVSSGSTRFASITAGGLHTCALTAEGQAWCWGENGAGQAGFPAAMTLACGEPIHGWQCVPSPHAIETVLRFDALVAGGANTCGFDRDGAIYCWGSNAAGQLGAATTETCDGVSCSRTPLALPTEPKLRALALGTAAHICGLTAEGAAYCWGSNASGQLGLGTAGESRDVPTAVIGERRFKAIAVGGEHTCALTTDGNPWCWGRDILPPGEGGQSFSATPVAIESSPPFVDLITGTWAACGRTAAGSVHCWGINAYGEMGITPTGLNTRFSTPQEMAGSPRWTTISGSWATFCGLDAAGDTWCWGHGADGELGPAHDNSAVPVRIDGV